MVGAELDSLVEEMAALLGAPCVLEDSDFNLVGYAAQEDVDELRQHSILARRATPEIRDWFHGFGIKTADSPVRTPGDEQLGISPRLCVPARHLNRAYGYFWLIDPDSAIPESRWPEAMKIAATAALMLGQAGRRQARLEAHVDDVLTSDRASARRAAEEIAALTGIDPERHVVCLLVSGPGESLELLSRRARRPALWVTDPSGARMVITTADRVAGRNTPAELLSQVTAVRVLEPALLESLRCGVGPVVAGLEHIATSWSGARVALRVARRQDETPLAAWEAVGALRLLGVLRHDDMRLTVFAGAPGRFALEGDASLVWTAWVYLEQAGSAARAAAVLSIHRQSLYHRLRLIETATGLDLTKGQDRLIMHLALTLRGYLGPDEEAAGSQLLDGGGGPDHH